MPRKQRETLKKRPLKPPSTTTELAPPTKKQAKEHQVKLKSKSSNNTQQQQQGKRAGDAKYFTNLNAHVVQCTLDTYMSKKKCTKFPHIAALSQIPQWHEKQEKSEINSDLTLLERIIFPMKMEEFRKNIFKKKAYYTTTAQSNSQLDLLERLQVIIHQYLFDLNLENMLEETSSERIHVWMKEIKESAVPGTIDSFTVEESRDALVCHRGGASLYFRAPTELEEHFITEITQNLGMNFAAVFPSDGKQIGEIETFVSRKGHVTNFHYDYMENFTIQLSGVKKWTLIPSFINHPQRGCTPHYKPYTTFEQQMKLISMQNPNFQVYPPENIHEAQEIVLTPGNILYFPAGMTHKVECLEDSISINLSLICSSYADIVCSGIKQALWKMDPWRAGIANVFTINDCRTQLSNLLDSLKKTVNSLTVEDFLPKSIILPRKEFYDLSEMENDENMMQIFHQENCDSNSKFKFNPLAVLIRADKRYVEIVEEYQSDSESDPENDSENDSESDYSKSKEQNLSNNNVSDAAEAYILNINFANDDMESLIRIAFRVPSEMVPLFEYLKHNQNSTQAFEVSTVLKSVNAEHNLDALRTLQILSFAGFIHLNQLK